MLKYLSNSAGGSRISPTWVALLVVAVAVASASADKKPKKPAGRNSSEAQRIRASVNRDMLVWPNLPAIARIRWLDQLTGEPFDPDALTPAKGKKKQSWMDRLAGAQ